VWTDRSIWEERETERRRRVEELVAKVNAALPEVRRILLEHGVEECYLFGSLATGHPRPESDVDLALGGCPPDQLFRVSARLERAFALPLDVVDLELADPALAAWIRARGRRIHP
jgi:predicted nucleotidyltransferase